MHPSARIACWLVLALSTQVTSGLHLLWGSLLLLACKPPVWRHGWTLLRRSRILLLSLWLILAYSLPGETWHDLAWLPSDTGIQEANLHAGRLCLLLASLAWLLNGLTPQALMAGLWQLLQPLAHLGLSPERTVVRLSLVLGYLEHLPPLKSWRDLLAPPPVQPDHNVLTLPLPPWRATDSGWLAACVLLMLLLWMA